MPQLVPYMHPVVGVIAKSYITDGQFSPVDKIIEKINDDKKFL